MTSHLYKHSSYKNSVNQHPHHGALAWHWSQPVFRKHSSSEEADLPQSRFHPSSTQRVQDGNQPYPTTNKSWGKQKKGREMLGRCTSEMSCTWDDLFSSTLEQEVKGGCSRHRYCVKSQSGAGTVVHMYYPSSSETETGGSCFEVRMSYIMRSRPAWTV